MTITDVGSAWTEECALLNNAHRWVKERIEQTKAGLPFPMLGIDSDFSPHDNGGEFINRQLLDWCTQNGIAFTRGRPYRKNDNCFVEQKNGDVVRKTVGYARFEGEAAYKRSCPGVSLLKPHAQLLGADLASYCQGKAPLRQVQENLREGAEDPLINGSLRLPTLAMNARRSFAAGPRCLTPFP